MEYTTNFGVRFTSKGNRRTLGSFLGFRRAQPDGTVEFLDEIWKVSNRGCAIRGRKLRIVTGCITIGYSCYGVKKFVDFSERTLFYTEI